ncbi:MAG: hypothetical protein WBI63_03955 [Coriobacteriia bacterium]
MANQARSVKQAAEEIGATPRWVRKRIAAGAIAPKRTGNKRNGTFVITDADLETLRTLKTGAEPVAEEVTTLARITQLEADRSNLLAQVAWARAISREQQKALEAEQQRTERLSSEVAAQRDRVEALKALSVLDRILGRHKRI